MFQEQVIPGLLIKMDISQKVYLVQFPLLTIVQTHYTISWCRKCFFVFPLLDLNLLYYYTLSKFIECLLSTESSYILNIVTVYAVPCHKCTILLQQSYFDVSNIVMNLK